MKVVALLSLKGGVGKTTTAIGLAQALAKDHRVGLIDVDPNGSALRWLETVDLVDAASSEAGVLAAVLDGVKDDYDVVVVDSAPNDRAAISSIAAVADLVLLPMSPSPLEFNQLADTVDLLPRGVRWQVVPVRVRWSTSSGRSITEVCESQGVPVTTATVPLQEAIAQAFGDPLPALPFAALGREVWSELEAAR